MIWSVVMTQPNSELLAQRHLREQGFEVYVPLVLTTLVRRGVKIARELPLFPRYVFVKIVDAFSKIRSTRGVTALVMSGDVPARVGEGVIKSLREREQGGYVHLEPPPARFRRGQSVRIVRGSFEGRIGIWDGQTSHERERVLLRLLGQVVPVELKSDALAA